MLGRDLKEKVSIGWLPATVALLVFLIAGLCAYALEKILISERRATVIQLSEEKLHSLDRQLSHGLAVTYTLATLLKLGDGKIPDFRPIAEELLPLYPIVSALQLVPNGVVGETSPLAGNEKAIGHDLLADERRNKEAKLAMATKRLTLAGPFTLIQGGEGMIGRLPVYVGKAEEKFWGFAAALIKLDDFLKVIDLGQLEQQGYAYQLGRNHPDTGQKQVFARSVGVLAENPVVATLEVPNGQWLLTVSPVDHWWEGRRLAIEGLICLLLSVLGALATYWSRRTRKQLEDKELHYQALYESTPAMLHSINTEGKIISVSRAWLESLGYAAEEVIGHDSVEFLTEDSRRYATEMVLPEFFRTGRCDDVEYQMVTRDGRVIDVLLSARAERDASGRLVQSLAVIRDVTEKKRVEDQLHQVLAEQKAIIENDLVGIVRVRGRRIDWANPGFEKMLGYGAGELTGVPTRQHYPDDASYEAFGNEAYPVIMAGKVFHAQLRLLHADGRVVWMKVSGGLLHKETEESLWAFLDITQLHEANEQIVSNKQRMELALAGADLGMWDWHLPSDVLTCNARLSEMFGYGPDELGASGLVYAGLINLKDRPLVRRQMIQHLHGETPIYEAEYRVRHKDEHWVWVLCRGQIVERDECGRVVRMSGTNLDISDRKAYEAAILEREVELANLVASIQDLVIVFDAGGLVQEYFYPSVSRHPGQDPLAPKGGNYLECLPATTLAQLTEAMGEVLISGGVREIQYTLNVASGALASQASLSAIVGKKDGLLIGFLAVVRDVTEAVENQRQIEQLSRRNALLLDSVGEGIYGVNVAGNITFINATALRLLGLTGQDVTGRNAHDLFHHHLEEGVLYLPKDCPVSNTLQDGRGRNLETECFWRQDGTSFPVSLNVAPVIEDQIIQGAVVVFQDITERRRIEEEIRQLAFFDPLTQLPNRRLLLDRLGQALAGSKRAEAYCALFFIDLDNFKNLNDTQGHDCGDQLLKQVARRLLACVREMDTVSRFGGDEFVLLCQGLGSHLDEAVAAIESIALKVSQALNAPYPLGDHLQLSSPSIGATPFMGGAVSVDELLKQADIAMYQAKAAGRNTWRIFGVTSNFGVTTDA